MVITSDINERKPTGGSSFAGHFNNKAFAAYVFPVRDPDAKGAFKDRLQRKEHLEMSQHPLSKHQANVAFTMVQDSPKPGPNRLRTACDEHRGVMRAGTAPVGMRASASSPNLGRTIGCTEEGWEAHAGSMGTIRPATSAMSMSAPVQAAAVDLSELSYDPQTAMSMTMNSRWYPHACSQRGELKLTRPAALLAGVDPAKDMGHKCPYFEGTKNRFAAVKGVPGAQVGVPAKSLRWKSDEHWNNPENQFSMKVTQSMPRRSMSATFSG